MKKIEAWYSTPPEHELPVVELFYGDEGQWGEINQDTGDLLIEIYPKDGRTPWIFNLDELILAFQKAKKKLGKE